MGLVRVQMWEYYWGHTKAQIELANVDGVYTCYKADDDKSKPSGERRPPSKEKMEETVRKWEANKQKRKMNLEKFLGAKVAGELSDKKD